MAEAVQRGDAAVDEQGKLAICPHDMEGRGRFDKREEDESADPDDDGQQTQRAQNDGHASMLDESAY